jgi:hypothetical protein
VSCKLVFALWPLGRSDFQGVRRVPCSHLVAGMLLPVGTRPLVDMCPRVHQKSRMCTLVESISRDLLFLTIAHQTLDGV